MTKRTAMLMAAGVVLALFGGSVALSFALSGGGTAEAGTDPKAAREKPIVRTIERTIRVEKKAKGSDRPVQVVTLSAPPSAAHSTEASSDSGDAYEQDDDAYEEHEGEDDAYEEHEGEDHGDDAYDGGYEHGEAGDD